MNIYFWASSTEKKRLGNIAVENGIHLGTPLKNKQTSV